MYDAKSTTWRPTLVISTEHILCFPAYILAKCHLFKCKQHVLEFQQLLKYASINLNYGIKHFYPSVPEADHLILERAFTTANPVITCCTTCCKMHFLPCQEVHTSMTEKAPCHTSVDDDDLVYAFTVQQVKSLSVNA